MSGVVAVIDYGMGNLHSVASALEQLGELQTADRRIVDAQDGRLVTGLRRQTAEGGAARGPHGAGWFVSGEARR